MFLVYFKNTLFLLFNYYNYFFQLRFAIINLSMINNIKNLIEQLCFDHGLTENFVLNALEEAIKQAWELDSGEGYDVGIHLNKTKFGTTFNAYRKLTIVEEVKHPQKEISLKLAKGINESYKIGDSIEDEIDLSKLSRSAIHHVDTYIKKNIQLQTKQNEFEFFSPKVGSLIICTVTAISNQGLGIIVSINGFEGIITDSNSYHFIKNEYIPGTRMKAYIYKVEENEEGFQVFLTRKSDEFLIELMKDEIPEVANDLVKIISVARNPGFASMIIVKSEDPQNKINEVSVCIGSGGNRIKNIQKELKGEKIYIFPWKDVLFTRIAMALSYKGKVPIHKIIVHDDNEEESSYIEVILPDEFVSKVIGPKGRNIDLISRAFNEKIKITPLSQYEKAPQITNEDTELDIIRKGRELKKVLELTDEEIDILKNLKLCSFEALCIPFQEFLTIPFPNNNHGVIYNKLLEYLDMNKDNNIKPIDLQLDINLNEEESEEDSDY
jgi:N utilization substance protein A